MGGRERLSAERERERNSSLSELHPTFQMAPLTRKLALTLALALN